MKILVVYYSMYGHVLKLAQAVVEGARSVPGAEVVMRRVEVLPFNQDKLKQSKHAQMTLEMQKEIPFCTLEDLRTADGILFGTPTRYGNMTAQMKALFDQTTELWVEGAMEGKVAGIFTSTATTHGGQETTGFTMMAPLLHLGMIIVGVPYSTSGMQHTEGRGGSPYAASTVAGTKNELTPTPEDMEIAKALGRRVAQITGSCAVKALTCATLSGAYHSSLKQLFPSGLGANSAVCTPPIARAQKERTEWGFPSRCYIR